jgi:hypothetical protein
MYEFDEPCWKPILTTTHALRCVYRTNNDVTILIAEGPHAKLVNGFTIPVFAFHKSHPTIKAVLLRGVADGGAGTAIVS